MEDPYKTVKCVIVGDEDVDKKELLFSYISRCSPTESQSSQSLDGEVSAEELVPLSPDGTVEGPRFLVLHHNAEDETKFDKEPEPESEAPDVWTDNVVVRKSRTLIVNVLFE